MVRVKSNHQSKNERKQFQHQRKEKKIYFPQAASIKLFKNLHRIQNTLLKPDQLPPQDLLRLRALKTHPALQPAITRIIPSPRLAHGDILSLRIGSAQEIGRGLWRRKALGEDVTLPVGVGGVFGAPDVHGGDVAHVDVGA